MKGMSSATSRWGIVEAVGSEVTQIKPSDRVVIPFNIACGHCFMCD
jgi:Zn-dependent alcohol dehydrogenase